MSLDIGNFLKQTRDQLLALAPDDYIRQIEAVTDVSLQKLGVTYEQGKSRVITITNAMRNDPLWSGLTKKIGDKTTVTIDQMHAYLMEGMGVVVDEKNKLVAYLDEATQGEFRKNAEAWRQRNFGAPVSIEEWMTKKNAIAPAAMAQMQGDPIFQATLGGIRNQIEEKTPSYLLALAPLFDKDPDQGAQSLAYIVASNAKQATNTGNMMSYVWQAAQEDRENGVGIFGMLGKLLATVLGDTALGRMVSGWAGGEYRQRAAEIGISQVGQNTADYLIKNYRMFEGDAYTIAQNVYREGMKSQGFEVASTPFDDKVRTAVHAEFQKYNFRKQHQVAEARIAELHAEHAQRVAKEGDAAAAKPDEAPSPAAPAPATDLSSELGLYGLSTAEDAAAAPKRNAWLQEQYNGVKEFVVGNNEFNYSDLITADLTALGMKNTSDQAMFRSALGLSQTVEGLTAATLRYFPQL